MFRFGLRSFGMTRSRKISSTRFFLDVWREAGKFERPPRWQLRVKTLSALRRGKDLGLDRRLLATKPQKRWPRSWAYLRTPKTRLFYARKKLAERLKASGVERGWP